MWRGQAPWLVALMLVAGVAGAETPTAEPPAAASAVPVPGSLKHYSDAELQLLQDLDARRVALERREQVLVVREALLDLAEERVTTQVKALEVLQGEIKQLLGNLSEKEEAELDALARIYENMKPQEAASLLNGLDARIVYDLFRRMKQKNTAKVLEKMDKAKARTVSEMLAEKSPLPPLAGAPAVTP